MRIFNAQVVTPERILPGGGVDVQDGRIAAVHEACSSGDIDLEGAYLCPGLIDIHCHPTPDDGATAEALGALCDERRANGEAGFLFALGNSPLDSCLETLGRLRGCLDEIGPERGCLGIHLEGPYIEPSMRGGFELTAITNPRDFPVGPLLDACGPWVKYINISVELPGALDAVRECRRRGIAVSMGHSAPTSGRLEEAIGAGVSSVCHIFNTGEIMRYKEPGVLDPTLDLVGLASEQLVCEVICDGVHVDPILMQLLRKAKGRDGVALITDSIIGGRAPREGAEFDTGTNVYRVTGGVGRNREGGLVGSTLNMARAVRNYARFTGCELVDAVRAGSLVPARLVGLDEEYGAIEQGRRALFCVLDQALEPVTPLCVKLNGPANGE